MTLLTDVRNDVVGTPKRPDTRMRMIDSMATHTKISPKSTQKIGNDDDVSPNKTKSQSTKYGHDLAEYVSYHDQSSSCCLE